MKFNSQSLCDICGLRKGINQADHSKCAIIRKEKYKDVKKTKRHTMKETKRKIMDTINFGDYIKDK